jgi:hydrogenase nickel incorporation protein HypA/HybF
MHELSIADAILTVAQAHAGDRRLVAVEVEVGHLRQVVPSALEFAFELLAPGVALEVTEVPAAGRCRACGAESELCVFPLACGACNGVDMEIVRGEELSVQAVEVEEPLLTGKGER